MKQSKVIALSAISASLCAVFLTLGSYVTLLDISCFMLGSVIMMLPLSKDYLLGGFLSYLVASILGLLFSGGNIIALLPFIIFFGIHPILNEILRKYKVNKIISFLIKIILFNISFFFIYKFTQLFVYDNMFLKLSYYIIALCGTAVFILYDIIMQRMQKIVNFYVAKLKL